MMREPGRETKDIAAMVCTEAVGWSAVVKLEVHTFPDVSDTFCHHGCPKLPNTSGGNSAPLLVRLLDLVESHCRCSALVQAVGFKLLRRGLLQLHVAYVLHHCFQCHLPRAGCFII